MVTNTHSRMNTVTEQKWLPRTAILGGLVVLAAALRVYRLTYWSFDGDEMNTLRDSLAPPDILNPKPLLFLLNHYLIAPWLPLDELGLRAIPVLFGIAAVPAVFLMYRLVVDERAALFAAVLLALSPWHIYWSQFARYYALVFFFSALFPFMLYKGVLDRRSGLIMAGLALAMCAILAHPTSGLVLLAFGLWLLLRRRHNLRAVKRAIAARPALSIVALLVMMGIGYRLSDLFVDWYTLRQDRWGYQGPILLLSYLGWLVPVIAVFGVAGISWLWRDGDRSLAKLLTAMLLAPILLLAALTYVVPISTAYLYATTPAIFLGAGYFLARLMWLGPTVLRMPLAAVSCLGAAIVADLPPLASHYQDGMRRDFRAAAQHLDRVANPSHPIVSDQPRVLQYYLKRPVLMLSRDPEVFLEQVDTVMPTPDRRLWLVVEVKSRGGFSEQGLGPLSSWVAANCRLSVSFARPRLDYKDNELRVYRCHVPAGHDLIGGSRPPRP